MPPSGLVKAESPKAGISPSGVYNRFYEGLPDNVRNDPRYGEIPAAMRDVDAARALRGQVADLEKSLVLQGGEEAKLHYLSLDDLGNIVVSRVPGYSSESLRKIVEFADKNGLGIQLAGKAGPLPSAEVMRELNFDYNGSMSSYDKTRNVDQNRAQTSGTGWIRNHKGVPMR